MTIEIPSTKIKTTILNLDPQSIKLASQATIAKMLFSPLVAANENGIYEAVLADNFYWEKNDLIFEIRGKVKVSNGRKVFAHDVAQSLRRMARMSNSVHGNLLQFLDTGHCSKKNEDCIILDENKVILKIKENYKNFVLSLLSNTESLIMLSDYSNEALLPREAFELSTGPYYVSEWMNDSVVLKANKNHPFYSERMPQEVKFRDIEGHGKLKEELKESQNMLIPGYIMLNTAEFDESGLMKELNIFQTQDIKLQYLTFTKDALKKHSYRRRLAFSKKVREIYLASQNKKNNIKSYSYLFSLKRHGALDPDQQAQISKNEIEVKELTEIETGEGFTLSVPEKSYKDFFEKLFSKDMPGLKIIIEEGKEYGSSGDFGWFYRDMSFFEDFSLLNYFLETMAHFSAREKEKWIDEFVSLDSEELRNEKVKDLHYQTLIQGVTIPICIEPYFIISKKPWTMVKSDLFADTPVWKLQRDSN